MLPMKSNPPQEIKCEVEKQNGFSSVIEGLKARHPELFSENAEPVNLIMTRVVVVPDNKSAAAGDDWAEEVSVSGEREVVE